MVVVNKPKAPAPAATPAPKQGVPATMLPIEKEACVEVVGTDLEMMIKTLKSMADHLKQYPKSDHAKMAIGKLVTAESRINRLVQELAEA